MNSIELFTGAGGLAIGISNAGFRHQAAIDRDKDACFTILSNQQRGIQAVADWPVFQTDVSQFDFTTLKIKGEIDLLAGGPPCQPFSQAGKHQGWDDKRDIATAKAVKPFLIAQTIFKLLIFLASSSCLLPSASCLLLYVSPVLPGCPRT